MQPHDHGALAFDDFAHALELTCMGVTPSLIAQQLALFGVGLLELDAIDLGGFNHFDSGRLQQLDVGGVCHGFLLHRGVHDHPGQFLHGDLLEGDHHLHGAGKKFFYAFFAQSFTEAPQLRAVARPLVLEILIARKVLPSLFLDPALDHILVTLVERMLEVQQRQHQAGKHTRPASI